MRRFAGWMFAGLVLIEAVAAALLAMAMWKR